MKGQLSIEYYVSLILFAMFIAYLSIQIIRITPGFMNELKNENLRIEAYKLSEVLINDPGEPIYWNTVPTQQIKRIGLSSNENITNLLSKEKITALQNNCTSDYGKIRNSTGTEYYFSLLLINKTSNEFLIDCKPPVSSSWKTNATISRIVAIDDKSMGELILYVW